ncbi:VOC family protein [Mycolicibacterium sp.]|uniref:VOC family protein n=1 Tax=Mycolicibacterium sp. TaxID=2320850 RepID=UPI003D0C0855
MTATSPEIGPPRGFGALTGLDHVGIGVSDMAASLAFYRGLGFDDVVFDISAELPGIGALTHHPVTAARIALLRSSNPTPLGQASIKLVQLQNRPNAPLPEGMAWGERGVCEVCVHTRGHAGVYADLMSRGHRSLMEPNEADLEPYQTHCGLSYVADPDGTKIELIEWSTLQAGWPGADGLQGVNHVAFGVTDIERTRDFYRNLGFTGQLFESDGYFEPMDSWFAPRTPPRLRMMLLTAPAGGGLEPVEQSPQAGDMRGEWGHLGPFEFAIGSRCLERSLDYLDQQDIAIIGEPAAIDIGGGASWRYAYFVDPDGLYVCITEVRA